MLPDPEPGKLVAGAFRYYQRERVIYGIPAAEAVAAEAATVGAQRAFIMTTRSLGGEDGLAATIAKALGTRYAGTYAGITAHAPMDRVLEGAAMARAARADLVVAIGGGSVIDAAKATLLCLWYDLSTAEGLAVHRGTPGSDPSRRPSGLDNAVRVLAVPTTLSGAEFTCNAGLGDLATQSKVMFRHPLLTPQTVVLDPAFTLQTPLEHLLATGVKAVDHAVEFLCSPTIDPYSSATCTEALKRLSTGLPGIKADPRNLAMRLDCQLGVWMAITGLATRGVGGASHALGHTLGGSYGIPHGITSCVTLAAVMRWNAVETAAAQKSKISAPMGSPDEDAGTLIENLIAALDLPHRLRDIAIKRSDFPAIAEHTMHDHMVQFNPRKIAGPKDILEILDLAW